MSNQTAAAETKNLQAVTILLRLECRGRKQVAIEYYETVVQKQGNATLEDFKPFVLEKASSNAFGEFLTRTTLAVEQYDPKERHLIISHSLPQSKASDFAFDLEYGHGFKRNRSIA